MQAEQFKLLNAARAMGEFTTRELAQSAGVNIETAKTMLRRQADLFEPTGAKRPTPGGTKPSTVYRIRSDAHRDLLRLVDGGRDEAAPLTAVGPDEAAEAYQNDFNQWQTRRHLAEAREHLEGQKRRDLIRKAAEWMRQEQMRIARWRNIAEPPEQLSEALCTLELQLASAKISADLLDREHALDRVDSAAEWFVRGLDLMFAHQGRPDERAFAPLEINASSPLQLVEQLLTAVRGSGVSCSLPTERMALAVLIALPRLGRDRWEGRTPVQCACDLLDAIGPGILGDALTSQFLGYDSYSTPWVANSVRDILVAFTLRPALLSRKPGSETIALWFTSLRGTALWHEDHVMPMLAAARYFAAWSPKRAFEFIQPVPPNTEKSRERERQLEARMPALAPVYRYASRIISGAGLPSLQQAFA